MQYYAKLWIEPNLDGPVRVELSAAERGVYYDLYLLAKKLDQAGHICTPSGKPYPDRWTAARLNITAKLLSKTASVLTTLGIAKRDENGIFLIHFLDEQSSRFPPKTGHDSAPKTDDPAKYVRGRYAHMVIHNNAEADAARKRRKELNERDKKLADRK